MANPIKTIAAFVAAISVLAACNKQDKAEHPCNDVICDASYNAVNLHIIDQDGKALPLDWGYLVQKGEPNDTVKTFTPKQLGNRYSPVIYPTGPFEIMNDKQIDELRLGRRAFEFIALKDGKEYHIPMILQGDCCHITRKFGVDTFVIAR